MYDPTIPRELQSLIDRELDAEERVNWVGTPRQTFFTPRSVGSFLFGIPWTPFALFWTSAAAGMTENSRREKSDGSGDLVFSSRVWRNSDGDRHREELGFFRTPEVKQVERKLRELAGAHKTFTEN